jgi:chemotaxis protein methyltransferase CheR
MASSSTTGPAKGALPVPNPHLLRIRDLIHQTSGLLQPDSQLGIFEYRCLKRMQKIGVTSLESYFLRLTAKSSGHAEIIMLLKEVRGLSETGFFSSPAVLGGFRQVALPRLVAARAHLPVKHLRIWSAGCSTGEEPYSVAMILQEETTALLRDWTFEVLATDRDQASVAFGQRGVYHSDSTVNLSPEFRQKYTTPLGDQFKVDLTIKAKVSISCVDMKDDARMLFLKGFDGIFCCNVLGHFDTVFKKRLVQFFWSSLLPHGYLFLGARESLHGVNDDFRLVQLGAVTAYTKQGQ